MAVRNMKYVEGAAQGVPAEPVHIEGLPDGSKEIGNGSVTTEKLANCAVTGEKMANGCVQAEAFQPGCVRAEALAESAVETGKIKNGAVTKEKLAGDVEIPEKYVLPAASTGALGGVKQVAAADTVSAADAKKAASESVSKAEFDAAVAVANECKSKYNAFIAAMKAAGMIAGS